MNNENGFGFIPIGVAIVAGLSAVIAGGTTYYITKKVYENQYYDCLEKLSSKGTSIEETKRICIAGKKNNLISQLIVLPVVGLFAYGVFKTLTER